MQNIMQQEKPLCLVGYSHLIGQHGLLQKFKDQHYSVTLIPNAIQYHPNTLKRQLLPATIAIGSFIYGLYTLKQGISSSSWIKGVFSFIFSSAAFLLSREIFSGIWERTNFLFSKNNFFSQNSPEPTPAHEGFSCVRTLNRSADKKSFG